MLEHLIQKDQQLLIYLNNLGTEFWDPVFMYITHQINWWPFFFTSYFFTSKENFSATIWTFGVGSHCFFLCLPTNLPI